MLNEKELRLQGYSKRNIFLWTLYDFANSIITVVFFLYFSQWLVIDKGFSDLSYNLIFVVCAGMLILTTPIAGSIADKTGIRMPFLIVVTIMQFVCLLITSMIAIFLPQNTFNIYLIVIFFLLWNYFYLFSFTFYNSLLHNLAPPNLQGLVSGIGQAANWLGQLFGLLITLPFALGLVMWGMNSGRVQPFLPATLLFVVLSLPMLIMFKDPIKPRKVQINLLSEYKNVFQSFKEVIKMPGMKLFLLGHFFFNDAMITVTSNMPIYMDQVFKLSDTTKSILLMSGLLTSAVGAILVGWISDKVGLKRTLLVILVIWIITFPIIAMISSFILFTIAIIFLGFLFGATWTVSRAFMSELSSVSTLNRSFTYYTVAERFSSFIGPLTWGAITSIFITMGNNRYKIALIAMAVFVFIGLIMVKKIPTKTSKNF